MDETLQASLPVKEVSTVASHRHFEALDGLRAIAIIAVMVHHYAPILFRGGTPSRDALHLVLDLLGTGVDLFFALSGFLITGILYDSLGRADYFRRFYWRRSLRIFPAYFAFLLPFLFRPHLFQHLSRWWFVLYLRNWLGPDTASDQVLGHLWSLAVEEQFYIFWAVAVFLCSRKRLPWLIVALSASAFIFRIWMVSAGFSRYDLIRFTPARMDGLLLGGLVAIAWRCWPWASVKVWARWGVLLSLAALIALFALSGNTLDSYWPEVTLSSCTAVFFASVVALSLDTRGSILASPVLANIAKYSYAMYLWHLVFHVLGMHALDRVDQWGHLAASAARLAYIPFLFALTYGLARLSWSLIEEPFLRLKDKAFTITNDRNAHGASTR